MIGYASHFENCKITRNRVCYCFCLQILNARAHKFKLSEPALLGKAGRDLLVYDFNIDSQFVFKNQNGNLSETKYRKYLM